MTNDDDELWSQPLVQKFLVSLGAILAATVIATLLIIWATSHTPPSYSSAVTIDAYGANGSSLKWEYRIEPPEIYSSFFPKEIWSYCDFDLKNVENAFDFTGYKGVRFYLKGNIENLDIEFNLFTHNRDLRNHEVYQYMKRDIRVGSNWIRKEILFENLTLASWTRESYPHAPDRPDLTRGYAMGFAIKTVTPELNQIWIDEMYFLKNDGTSELMSSFNDVNATIKGEQGAWHTGWGYRKS